MSHSLRPHRLQPSRLLRPSDCPGKNTGVGCHCLLQYMKRKSESEVAQSGPSLRPHGLQPTRLLRPWDSPGKTTGVGCHCLLPEPQVKPKNSGVGSLSLPQGISPVQGSNPGLPHCRRILYLQHHLGSPTRAPRCQLCGTPRGTNTPVAPPGTTVQRGITWVPSPPPLQGKRVL